MFFRWLSHSLARWFLALAVFFASLVGTPVIADEGKENLVKAAFIFNFVKFVEWQGDKSISKQSKIDICVLGSSGIIRTSKVFSQASSAKLSLALVSEQSAGNAPSHCHVLFISASEEGRLSEILSSLKGHPVLTISDGDNFADKGVMVGFVNRDGKIKLEVNKSAAESAGLKIDSQLLEIALRVI